MAKQNFTAKTLYGLEDLAVKELTQFGASKLVKGNRIVEFEGDQALLYKANLCSRSILRILQPISSFTAHNDRHLYQMAKKVNWSKYLRLDQSFAIDSTVNGKRFKHSQYAALKVKDAIVDQFKEETQERPNVNTRNPDIRINLHISETDVTLSLDSSGDSLEKRGYRTESNEAPMSECLAAAMILLSEWDMKTPLVDAMTGSGTIAIEAALIATNTPPGLFRSFGFERWPDFDAGLYKQIQHQLRTEITAPQTRIIARDINAQNISTAKRNASRAAVIEHIAFEKQDFLTSDPLDVPAVFFMNPPYGERLDEEEDMLPFYHDIGFRLKHHFPGNKLWVISGNLSALKRIGLKPDHKFKLFNGSIECRLNGYSLFAGKRVEQ